MEGPAPRADAPRARYSRGSRPAGRRWCGRGRADRGIRPGLPSSPLSARSASGAQLVVADVGVLARSSGLAVLAERDDVVVAFLAGLLIGVGLAPGVEWDVLAQVGPVPLGFVLRAADQSDEAQLGGGVVPRVEPVLVDCLLQGVDLRLGSGDLRLADLPEVPRGDVADEQGDDGHDDQKLEEGETGLSAKAKWVGQGHILDKQVSVPSGRCRIARRGDSGLGSPLTLFPYCRQ